MARGPIKGRSSKTTSINPNTNRVHERTSHNNGGYYDPYSSRNRGSCSCACQGDATLPGTWQVLTSDNCGSGTPVMDGCGTSLGGCECHCEGGAGMGDMNPRPSANRNISSVGGGHTHDFTHTHDYVQHSSCYCECHHQDDQQVLQPFMIGPCNVESNLSSDNTTTGQQNCESNCTAHCMNFGDGDAYNAGWNYHYSQCYSNHGITSNPNVRSTRGASRRSAKSMNSCPSGQHWMPPVNGQPGYCMNDSDMPGYGYTSHHNTGGGYRKGARRQAPNPVRTFCEDTACGPARLDCTVAYGSNGVCDSCRVCVDGGRQMMRDGRARGRNRTRGRNRNAIKPNQMCMGTGMQCTDSSQCCSGFCAVNQPEMLGQEVQGGTCT